MAGFIDVSCVQMNPVLGDFDANISIIKEHIKEITELRPGTDLIVFPELVTSGYECTKSEFDSLAESIDMNSKSIRGVADLCKKYDVNVVYGLPETDPKTPDVLYNSSVMIGNEGSILGSFRKIHPFDEEKVWCLPGQDISVINTPFGKIGLMICWDTAFPELARIYALQGADLLVVSSCWENPYSDDWDLFTRARAIDNTLHLVSSNRVGADRTLSFFGHSNIVSPVGKVISSLDDATEGVVHAKIDLGLTAKLREDYYSMFDDRHPQLYGELAASELQNQ